MVRTLTYLPSLCCSVANERKIASNSSRNVEGKQSGSIRLLCSSLIGKPKETVKQAGWEGLILIEGYAAGNNRQLAEHQSPMRLGFADNRLSGGGKWRSGRHGGGGGGG